MTGQPPGDDQTGRRPMWPRIGIGLGVGVGVLLLVLGIGVVVPLATTGDDEAWTPEERAVAAYGRTRAEDMLSGNAFQPAVTLAFEVDVLAAPETVGPAPRPDGVCRPGDPDRAAVARVQAQTVFGITLWTYEVTCTGASLVGGI